MHRSVIETLVGVIVIALCILFVFVVYTNSSIKTDTADSYQIKASFERADGIDVGSDVTISGVKVGKVAEKFLDPNTYTAVITMNISKSFLLPIDSSAEIASSGLLGDKYVSITPGADSENLKPGESIEFTQSSVSLESLIGKLMFGVSNKDESNKDENQYQEGGHNEDTENSHNNSQNNGHSDNNASNNNTTNNSSGAQQSNNNNQQTKVKKNDNNSADTSTSNNASNSNLEQANRNNDNKAKVTTLFDNVYSA